MRVLEAVEGEEGEGERDGEGKWEVVGMVRGKGGGKDEEGGRAYSVERVVMGVRVVWFVGSDLSFSLDGGSGIGDRNGKEEPFCTSFIGEFPS